MSFLKLNGEIISMSIKKLFFIIFTVFVSISILAEEKTNSQKSRLDYYKDLYFIMGNDTKVQISLKYTMYNFNKQHNFYFGYSQYMFWDLFKYSSPFREINYNPEFFYIFNKPFKYIDYVQISPYEHKSNGRDGIETRGVDKYYGLIQLSTQTYFNFGLEYKLFGYYRIEKENQHIKEYMGDSEIKLFVNLLEEKGEYLTDKEEIYIKLFTTNIIKFHSYELGFKLRMVTEWTTPYFFINYYSGYGESLIDYNKKVKSWRAGIILNY